MALTDKEKSGNELTETTMAEATGNDDLSSLIVAKKVV